MIATPVWRSSVAGSGDRADCEVPDLLRVKAILGNGERSLDGTYHQVEAHYAAFYLAELQ